MEAFNAHFAGVDSWTRAFSEHGKCLRLVKESLEMMQKCIAELPPPESFLPKDRRKDEVLDEYMERKKDEWEEKECFWDGLLRARYIGEERQIEAQCKRDLEVKRLRKAVEKLTGEKR